MHKIDFSGNFETENVKLVRWDVGQKIKLEGVELPAIKYYTGQSWYILSTSNYVGTTDPSSIDTAFKGAFWINHNTETAWYKYSSGTGPWYRLKAMVAAQPALYPHTYVSGVSSPPIGRYVGDLALDINRGNAMFWTGSEWKQIVS